jgi:hypothetical protein
MDDYCFVNSKTLLYHLNPMKIENLDKKCGITGHLQPYSLEHRWSPEEAAPDLQNAQRNRAWP